MTPTLKQLYTYQTRNIGDILHYFLDDFPQELWLTRKAAGDNLTGFMLWHVPSAQDFIIQTLIRGVPEVRFSPEWQNRPDLDTRTLSFGISLSEADAAVRASTPAAVLAYGRAVQKEISQWLKTIDDDFLASIPDGRLHIAQSPQYQNAHFNSAELNQVLDIPVWGLLTATCYGHLRSHFGEVEILRAQYEANQQAMRIQEYATT